MAFYKYLTTILLILYFIIKNCTYCNFNKYAFCYIYFGFSFGIYYVVLQVLQSVLFNVISNKTNVGNTCKNIDRINKNKYVFSLCVFQIYIFISFKITIKDTHSYRSDHLDSVDVIGFIL